MLSRVAEAIYWTARYVERAENTARLVSVNANLLMDLPKGTAPGWEPLIDIIGGKELFESNHDEYSERNVARFFLGDAWNASSIIGSLHMARENARTVRDLLPRESWEQINNLHLYATQHMQSGLSKRGRFDYLRTIIAGVQQLTGMLAGTMNNDYGYNFLRMGRNLERADMTTRIVDVRSASLLPDAAGLTPFENIQWMSVLHSLSGYQVYRQSMHSRVRRPDVLKFLLQNAQFPRAYLHCVGVVEACLQELPRSDSPLRTIARGKRHVQQADVAGLRQNDLHEFIDDLQCSLSEVHNDIAITYFLLEAAA